MYITIRRYAGNAGLADELAARSDDVKQVIEPVQGFREYFIVKSGDATATITICDDQAGADASTQRASAWISENLPEIASSPPEITAGEVTFSTAAHAHA